MFRTVGNVGNPRCRCQLKGLVVTQVSVLAVHCARVGFGVSPEGHMLNSLVAVGIPNSGTPTAFYIAGDHATPVQASVRRGKGQKLSGGNMTRVASAAFGCSSASMFGAAPYSLNFTGDSHGTIEFGFQRVRCALVCVGRRTLDSVRLSSWQSRKHRRQPSPWSGLSRTAHIPSVQPAQRPWWWPLDFPMYFSITSLVRYVIRPAWSCR